VVAVWRATPGEGWLAALFGNPAALPLTRLYDRFAIFSVPGTGARVAGSRHAYLATADTLSDASWIYLDDRFCCIWIYRR
jgi:hypothetical protein